MTHKSSSKQDRGPRAAKRHNPHNPINPHKTETHTALAESQNPRIFLNGISVLLHYPTCLILPLAQSKSFGPAAAAVAAPPPPPTPTSRAAALHSCIFSTSACESIHRVSLIKIGSEFKGSLPSRRLLHGLYFNVGQLANLPVKLPPLSIQPVPSEFSFRNRFFLSGGCKAGVQCRFKHPSLNSSAQSLSSLQVRAAAAALTIVLVCLCCNARP